MAELNSRDRKRNWSESEKSMLLAEAENHMDTTRSKHSIQVTNVAKKKCLGRCDESGKQCGCELEERDRNKREVEENGAIFNRWLAEIA